MVPLLLLAAMLAQASPRPLTVSAAISLTEALEDAATAYLAAGGTSVVFNFGGSNALARQIVNGAPADVFISADEAQMEVVENAQLVAAGTRTAVVANRLVLVADSRSPLKAVADLEAAGVRRIAIGDPVAVPGGVYARQYLERVGRWTRLEPKIVPVANVRAALTAVQNGSADAAFVYATDARIAPALRLVTTIDGPQAPRIVYPGCVVKTTQQPAEAAKFLSFLRTAPARAIFERHGFLTPADAH